MQGVQFWDSCRPQEREGKGKNAHLPYTFPNVVTLHIMLSGPQNHDFKYSISFGEVNVF